MITTLRNYAELSQFSDAHFRFVLKATASWCKPCKEIAPLFQMLSSAHAALWYAEFDVDKAKDIGDFYKIEAMPTFLFIEQGQIKQTLKGPSRAQLQGAVAAFSALFLGGR